MRLQILYQIVFLASLIPEITFAGRTNRNVVFEREDDSDVLSNCLTPNGQRDLCVRLTSCSWLKQHRVSRNRLQKYICGFEGDEPMICCRESISMPDVSVTARPTTRPAWNETDTSIAASEIPETTLMPVNSRTDDMTKPSFLPRDCGKNNATGRRIVNGLEAQRGSYPWMAVVFVRKGNGGLSRDCGGTLVTRSHVVTAAHCLVDEKRKNINPLRIFVRLGAHNLSVPNEPGAVDIGVADARIHYQFERNGTHKNDIAVLKLNRPVIFTRTIAPACLPYDNLRDEDLTNNSVFVTGFGETAFYANDASDVLLETNVEVQAQEICENAYEDTLKTRITRVYMCAGGGGKDACRGDSGGPLLALGKGLAKKYYLVGIVSFGKGCAKPGYPGVYTRVTEFLDWLTENLSN